MYGHPDVNDWFETIDDVGEIINSYVDEVPKLNFKRYKYIIDSNNALLKKEKKENEQ